MSGRFGLELYEKGYFLDAIIPAMEEAVSEIIHILYELVAV